MQIRMLREIDAMFEDVQPSRKLLEVKEEMLQNLMEKYEDLIAQGKSEEAAFNIAIGSVGDIDDLIEELQQPVPKVASFPEPDMSGYADEPSSYETAVPEDQEAFQRHNRAMIVTIAVMLYILSPVAVIFIVGKMGLLCLFAMIAAGTGLLVYNGMTGKRGSMKNPPLGSVDEDVQRKMTKRQKHFFGSLSSALWLITVALYFVISFATGAWHISWIIFLIAAAANNVLKAFVDLYRE